MGVTAMASLVREAVCHCETVYTEGLVRLHCYIGHKPIIILTVQQRSLFRLYPLFSSTGIHETRKEDPGRKPLEAKSVIPCVDIFIGFENSLPPLNRICLPDMLSDQCHLLIELTLTYEKKYNTSVLCLDPRKNLVIITLRKNKTEKSHLMTL
jgi:hypothetical protein